MASKNQASPKRNTIYDIAKATGVSAGTVSRALNGKGNVSQETRNKILKAAQELNIKPSSSSGTKIVALFNEPTFTDRVIGYSATLSTHLSYALASEGIAVIEPQNPFEELSSLFIDGLIAVTYNKESEARLAELEKTTPMVYLDKFEIQKGQHTVGSDHHQAGYIAAQHLIEAGKQKPGFYSPDVTAFRKRLAGFTQAINERGLSITPDLYSLRSENDNAYSAIAKLIRNGCDGIYVPGSSLQAIEAMHVLQYVMGMKIPEDISIIGGENEGLSRILSPPLTTVKEPLLEMATAAVEMICKRIRKVGVDEKRMILPVSITERSSVSHSEKIHAQ